MCVQDYNLAQAMQIKQKTFDCTVGTYHLIMPASKSRVGFVPLYPNTSGNFAFGQGDVNHIFGVINSSMSPGLYVYWLPSHGPFIQLDIWVKLNATQTFNWIEYHLPLDKQERLRFAEGFNNK